MEGWLRWVVLSVGMGIVLGHILPHRRRFSPAQISIVGASTVNGNNFIYTVNLVSVTLQLIKYGPDVNSSHVYLATHTRELGNSEFEFVGSAHQELYERYLPIAREEAISLNLIQPDAHDVDVPFSGKAWEIAATEIAATAGKKLKGNRLPGFGDRGTQFLNLPTSRKRPPPSTYRSYDIEKDATIAELKQENIQIKEELARQQEEATKQREELAQQREEWAQQKEAWAQQNANMERLLAQLAGQQRQQSSHNSASTIRGNFNISGRNSFGRNDWGATSKRVRNSSG